jgi:hypothetical protein
MVAVKTSSFLFIDRQPREMLGSGLGAMAPEE